jgi:hypothetical protein
MIYINWKTNKVITEKQYLKLIKKLVNEFNKQLNK